MDVHRTTRRTTAGPSRPRGRPAGRGTAALATALAAVGLAGLVATGAPHAAPGPDSSALPVAPAAGGLATAPLAQPTGRPAAQRPDAPPDVERVRIFDATPLTFEETRPERTDGSFVIRWESQVAARVLDLPDPTPGGERLAIRAVLTVQPRPGDPADDAGDPLVDPWTRLGTVTVAPVGEGPPMETELVRFTTGYGAGGRYEADVTALAPLLRGRRLVRVFVATYGDTPGWEATFDLVYERAATGRRDPLLAAPVFDDPHVHAARNVLRRTLTVPAGIDVPRLRILTTGHATDGTGANEFVSAVHELRVDGRLVARWRPWRENGPELRPLNPWAGSISVGPGRDLRASDLDRSGWGPGLAVDPMIIPLPELRPGLADLELRIIGIRPEDPQTGAHGYFAVNATLLGDRAWE